MDPTYLTCAGTLSAFTYCLEQSLSRFRLPMRIAQRPLSLCSRLKRLQRGAHKLLGRRLRDTPHPTLAPMVTYRQYALSYNAPWYKPFRRAPQPKDEWTSEVSLLPTWLRLAFSSDRRPCTENETARVYQYNEQSIPILQDL